MNLKLLLIAGLTALCGCNSPATAGEFDPIPFSAQERELRTGYETILRESPDPDAALSLARLLVMHNEFDAAGKLLEPLVEGSNSNPQAKVWLGVLTTKRAGAAIPWDMGIRKIYLAKKGLRLIDEAYAEAPKDFDVRVTSIIAGASVGRFGALEKAVARAKDLEATLSDSTLGYTAGAVAAIHLAIATVRLAEGRKDLAKASIGSAKASSPSEDIAWQISRLETKIGS